MKTYNIVGQNGKELETPELFHPGVILKEEIESRGIVKKDFAKLIHILPSHLSEIFAGKRSISAKTALKLEKALNISASFWLRFQSDYDLKLAKNANDPVIKEIDRIISKLNHPDSSLANILAEDRQTGYEKKHNKTSEKSVPKKRTNDKSK